MGNFWPTFQSIDGYKAPEVPEASVIITDVLETFDIPSGGVIGGKLQNVNLKRVNPMDAIKASLLELMSEDEAPTEFCVDENGRVITYKVGEGSFSALNIYYTISSVGYTPKRVGVMVTGGKPKIKRIVFPWENVIGKNRENYTIWDATHMNSNCIAPGFTTTSIITYNDPIYTSGNSSYANGIKELFEVANTFQSIVGYAWQIIPSWNSKYDKLTKISQQSNSLVPMLLDFEGNGVLPENGDPGFTLGQNARSPNIGVPRRRANEGPKDDPCFDYEDGSVQGGKPLVVSIPLKEGLTYRKYGSTIVNKFINVAGVYFVGINLTTCRGVPKLEAAVADNTKENTVIITASENTKESVYSLSESEEYTVDYSSYGELTEADKIEIQFANNSFYKDKGTFGTHVPFYIQHDSTELFNLFSGNSDGPIDDLALKGLGTILPTKSAGGGLLIKQVWIKVSLDTPCFVIQDPSGQAADKAKELEVNLTAIALEELPNPIAVNGDLVDQADGLPDNDPTTVQDFEETAMSKAMKLLDSGRTANISLGSLSEAQTIGLSKNLYDLIKKDTGMTYAHTCAPTATPKLGQRGPNGGVINSISYNYQDQASYLINVVEGPEYYGNFASLNSGIYKKQTETINAVATVLQDLGNHIDFKIRVDGMGDISAINGYPGVLDVKDRVSVTLYNNPVED